MHRQTVKFILIRSFVIAIISANAVALMYALLHFRDFVGYDQHLATLLSDLTGAGEQPPPSWPEALLTLDFVGVLFACLTAGTIVVKRTNVIEAHLLALFLCAFALLVGPVWTFAAFGPFWKVPVQVIATGFSASAWLAAASFLRLSYVFPHRLKPVELTARGASSRHGIARLLQRRVPCWERTRAVAAGISQASRRLYRRCIPFQPHPADARVLRWLFAAFVVCSAVEATLALVGSQSSLARAIVYAAIATRVLVAAVVVAAVLFVRIADVVRKFRRSPRSLRHWAPVVIAIGAASWIVFPVDWTAVSVGGSVVGLAAIAASLVSGPAPLRARNFDHLTLLLLADVLWAVGSVEGAVLVVILALLMRGRLAMAFGLSETNRFRIRHPVRWVRIALRHEVLIWALALGMSLLAGLVFIGGNGRAFGGLYMFMLLGSVFVAVMFGVRNLRLGYALTPDPEERHKTLWLVNGCAAALAMLFLLLVAMLFPPLLPTGFADLVSVYGLNLLLPLVSITSFAAVFYRGAVDPKLVLTRASFYGVMALSMVIAFGVIEDFIKLFMMKVWIIPDSAVPFVAGGSSAVAVLPVHHLASRAETRLKRLFGTAEALTGEAVLLMSALSGAEALQETDVAAAAEVAHTLKAVARHAAEQNGGAITGALGSTVVLSFPWAEPAVEAAREIASTFPRVLRRASLPCVDISVAVHRGAIYGGEVQSRVLRELEQLCRAAEPGRVAVSRAVSTESARVFVGREFTIVDLDPAPVR